MTEPWLTAEQLRRMFHVPLGTIYRWAHEDNWPRTKDRPRRYDPSAARSSATRRRENLTAS